MSQPDYRLWLHDFFIINPLIDAKLLEKYGDFEYWSADVHQLYVDLGDKDISFNFIELMELLEVSEEELQHFFQIDAWLSNRIFNLITEDYYQRWSVEDGAIAVTYESGAIEEFDIEAINKAMQDGNEDWSYMTLLKAFEG
ncbi:hypothetical protein [Shewanella marina]|uniref:hypothetical protein n=1 Tax=Shewanella marina TaxID=487319 RepID=UPI0004726ECB|nr:hypothetical protein [Shewanella marina]